jgi:uncharacterized membrane protein
MIPDPLHPAIVHFPIVLLLLGAPLAVLSLFLRKWHLPLLTAVVLSVGGVGAVVATWTGEEAAELAGELNGSGETALEAHEDWGERARNAGIVAAILAIASAALGRIPMAGRALGAATALAAVVAAYSVAQAGHYGGVVVYKHGVGVNIAAGASAGGEQGGPQKEQKQGDDD